MLVNLREARKEFGYTQAKMAELLHISQQTYSDYENGKTSPDPKTLIAIAECLDVSTDYLLGRTDELGAALPVSQELPEEELELLRLYHALPPEFKQSLLNSARLWAGEPASATEKKKA